MRYLRKSNIETVGSTRRLLCRKACRRFSLVALPIVVFVLRNIMSISPSRLPDTTFVQKPLPETKHDDPLLSSDVSSQSSDDEKPPVLNPIPETKHDDPLLSSDVSSQSNSEESSAVLDTLPETKHDDPFLSSNVSSQISSEEKAPAQPFIHFEIDFGRHYDVTYGGVYKCPLSDERVALHAKFEEQLGFSTWVDTNLKILLFGDSVGMQFSSLLDEAAGLTPDEREVLHVSWSFKGTDYPGVTFGMTRSHGVVAGWRTTGLLGRSGENRPGPNRRGGGWSRDLVNRLMERIEESTGHTNARFDVFVMKVPAPGWVEPRDITRQGIEESVVLANEVFGAKHMVLMTSPFNNNVRSDDDWRELQKMNDMMRDFAASYNASTGVENVVLLDVARWSEELIRVNAELIGYTSDQQSDQSYALDRLSCDSFTQRNWPASIGQTCAVKVDPGACSCIKNRLFVDGMHWCMESMGGRWSAGLSCVIDCAINNKGQTCERDCNERFMSLARAETLSSSTHRSSDEGETS